MKTIGHHTIEKRNTSDYIIKNGPFPTVDRNPYLGKGFYFWDNNYQFAKVWGNTRYNGNYIICKATLHLDNEIFLDLVGNRENIMYFEKLIKKLNRENWPIGKFIEFLKEKELDKNLKGIFPFKAIRALDYDKDNFKKYKFAEGKAGYTSLRPIFIICLFEKTELLLSDFKIIYPIIKKLK